MILDTCSSPTAFAREFWCTRGQPRRSRQAYPETQMLKLASTLILLTSIGVSGQLCCQRHDNENGVITITIN